MIDIWLKHKIIDKALSSLFNAVNNNFRNPNLSIKIGDKYNCINLINDDGIEVELYDCYVDALHYFRVAKMHRYDFKFSNAIYKCKTQEQYNYAKTYYIYSKSDDVTMTLETCKTNAYTMLWLGCFESHIISVS